MAVAIEPLACADSSNEMVKMVSEFRPEAQQQQALTYGAQLSILDRKVTDNSDDAGRMRAALIELNQWIGGRSNTTVEKDIRNTVSTMNSQQIAELYQEYQRRYGKTLSEELMNHELSTKSKTAIAIYLKGIDKRTAQDTLVLADQALKVSDIDLFQEVFRDAPQEVRAQFLQEGGETKIKVAFGDTSTDSRHGIDYAKSGELSLKNMIESNTSWLGSNEKAIEASLERMKSSERVKYTQGKELETKRIAGANNKFSKSDHEAFSYYKDVHTALEKAGNSSKVSKWEDMIAVKGGSLVSRLNAHKGFLYNDEKEKVLATAEWMSKADWQYLKGNPQAVKSVKESLSDLLTGDDLKNANSSLDRRLAKETFEPAESKSVKVAYAAKYGD